MRKVFLCLMLISLCACSGCDMIGGGSHGSLKRYEFNIIKAKLEVAVLKVIAGNKNIYREPEPDRSYKDTYKEIIKERNKTSEYQLDTNYVDEYNDGGYITIKIKTRDQENEYTFRFYGDEQYWKTSPTSEIFIAYAHDKHGKGGSEADKNVDPVLLEQFVSVFETEFINKVETVLKLKSFRTN